METITWFPFRGQVHAIDPAKTERLGKPAAICGVAPLASPEDTQTIALHEIPVGEPCRTCLVQVGLRSTSDEPLDHALERGFIPSADMGDLGNL